VLLTCANVFGLTNWVISCIVCVFCPLALPCLSGVIYPFLWVVCGDDFVPGPLLERVECVSSLGSSEVVLKLLPYHSAPFGASRPPVFCWPTSLVALSLVPLSVEFDPALHSLSSPFGPFQRPGVDPPFALLVVPGCDPPRSLVFFLPGVDPPWCWLSGVFCPLVGSFSGLPSSWFSVGLSLLDDPSVFLSLVLLRTIYPFGSQRDPVSVLLWCPLVGVCSVCLVVGWLVWLRLAFAHLS